MSLARPLNIVILYLQYINMYNIQYIHNFYSIAWECLHAMHFFGNCCLISSFCDTTRHAFPCFAGVSALPPVCTHPVYQETALRHFYGSCTCNHNVVVHWLGRREVLQTSLDSKHCCLLSGATRAYWHCSVLPTQHVSTYGLFISSPHVLITVSRCHC